VGFFYVKTILVIIIIINYNIAKIFLIIVSAYREYDSNRENDL